MNSPHFLLAGPTASGKTAAAQILAEELKLPVLSADSMLVYKGMDVGTAKPTAAERGNVPYYGIDLVEPSQSFSAGLWLEAAALAPSPCIAVGGTGLYFKALLEGLDRGCASREERAHWQELFAREGLSALQRELRERHPGLLEALGEDAANPRRVMRALESGIAPSPKKTQVSIPILRMERAALRRRILRRVEEMWRHGLLEEAELLRARHKTLSQTASAAIGYAEAFAFLDGELSEDAAKERIVVRTNQLAKKQETWFRHQCTALWVDVAEDEPPESVAAKVKQCWSLQ